MPEHDPDDEYHNIENGLKPMAVIVVIACAFISVISLAGLALIVHLVMEYFKGR